MSNSRQPSSQAPRCSNQIANQKSEQGQSGDQPRVFCVQEYQADGFIENLAYLLIRPPRFTYNRQLLRPCNELAGFQMSVHHIPFELSLYKPTDAEVSYVLLYLHGNSSSRLEGFMMVDSLPSKVALACFDFQGCGLKRNTAQATASDECQYLTLGKKESTDVDQAARFLKALGYVVVGWGRSMGAAALLLSEQIEVCVTDSAFSNLETLCYESSSKVVPCYMQPFVSCCFGMFFRRVQRFIIQQTQMDIAQMNICESINSRNKRRQICFIHGEEDDLISYNHGQKLYEAFKGSKQFILFEGTHNSPRPRQAIQQCFEFIENSLEVLEIQALQNKSKLKFSGLINAEQLLNTEGQKTSPRHRKKYDSSIESLKKKKIRIPKLQEKYIERFQNHQKVDFDSIRCEICPPTLINISPLKRDLIHDKSRNSNPYQIQKDSNKMRKDRCSTKEFKNAEEGVRTEKSFHSKSSRNVETLRKVTEMIEIQKSQQGEPNREKQN